MLIKALASMSIFTQLGQMLAQPYADRADACTTSRTWRIGLFRIFVQIRAKKSIYAQNIAAALSVRCIP